MSDYNFAIDDMCNFDMMMMVNNDCDIHKSLLYNSFISDMIQPTYAESSFDIDTNNKNMLIVSKDDCNSNALMKSNIEKEVFKFNLNNNVNITKIYDTESLKSMKLQQYDGPLSLLEYIAADDNKSVFEAVPQYSVHNNHHNNYDSGIKNNCITNDNQSDIHAVLNEVKPFHASKNVFRHSSVMVEDTKVMITQNQLNIPIRQRESSMLSNSSHNNNVNKKKKRNNNNNNKSGKKRRRSADKSKVRVINMPKEERVPWVKDMLSKSKIKVPDFHEVRNETIYVLKCPVENCDKTSTNKNTLEVHLKTHAGIKDFSCNNCGKEFVAKATLKRHKSPCSKRKRRMNQLISD